MRTFEIIARRYPGDNERTIYARAETEAEARNAVIRDGYRSNKVRAIAVNEIPSDAYVIEVTPRVGPTATSRAGADGPPMFKWIVIIAVGIFGGLVLFWLFVVLLTLLFGSISFNASY